LSSKRVDLILRLGAAHHQAGFIHSYTNECPRQAAGLHEEKAGFAFLAAAAATTMRVRHATELTQAASARLAGAGRIRQDPASKAAADGLREI
jgi:hypothetical protein